MKLLGTMAILLACTGLAAPTQTAPPDQKSDADKTQQATPDQQTRPAEPVTEAEVRTQPTPTSEDIINEFLKKRPEAIPILPTGQPDETVVRQSDSGSDVHARLPDGHILSDRAGRISKIGERWMFSFESDNVSNPEPPITMLECRILEQMVRESRGGTEPVIFIVTGEITDFRGENYLLPRMALRKRDLGNFKK
jgi:hypothetical protein